MRTKSSSTLRARILRKAWIYVASGVFDLGWHWLWDTFTTSIIAAVVNEYREVALLRQNYVSKERFVCVAGIMKIGESAEDAVIREVKEEIG